MEYTVKYVVVSRNDKTMMGPFDSEEAATAWANKVKWVSGYYIHTLNPVIPYVAAY